MGKIRTATYYQAHTTYSRNSVTCYFKLDLRGARVPFLHKIYAMKYLTSLFALLIACQLNAQNNNTIFAQPLTQDETGQHISFKVASEANIRQYVIEASTDSVNFEVIGTLPSKGNTLVPRVYQFTSITNYRYYRVKQTDYAGIATAVLQISEPLKLKEPEKPSPSNPALSHNEK